MRCLIVAPKRFYLFHEFFALSLKTRGHEVSVVNDEYPENIIGVLLGNFVPAISKLLTYRYLNKYLVENEKYDLVIIFKGRGISKKTIKSIRNYADRIIGYNFDSFLYNPGPLSWMNIVDKYSTFDHKDSIDYELEKIELFSSIENIEFVKKTNDLAVILKNHSDRLLYVDQISRILTKIKTVIFIYERNFFTFIKNFMIHPFLMLKWRKYISFKPMDYSSYIDIINRSFFTLDFAHPKQTGTTIRCFEALACKSKIITNNKNILKNPAFNENNVIIFPLNGNAEKLYEVIIEKKKMPCEFKARTINDFVDDILK